MADQLVVEVPGEVQILEVAQQGPPGAGGGGAAAPTYTAGAAIAARQPLALNAAGQAVPADALTLLHAGAVIGLAAAAAAQGEQVQVTAAGPVQHSGWAFTPGGPVLVGANGTLVQALPEGATYCQAVGRAVAADRMLVSIGPAYRLA